MYFQKYMHIRNICMNYAFLNPCLISRKSKHDFITPLNTGIGTFFKPWFWKDPKKISRIFRRLERGRSGRK